MKDKKREKEIIEYQVFTLRLHEETKKNLIAKRIKSGLSWNRFVLELLKKNGA